MGALGTDLLISISKNPTQHWMVTVFSIPVKERIKVRSASQLEQQLAQDLSNDHN